VLTVKDIRLMAERQGFVLEQGGTAKPNRDLPGNCVCARRTLANEACPDQTMYSDSGVMAVQDMFGLTRGDQEALEDGFEGNDVSSDIHNPYYQLGVELYESLKID
jgi:hypothetical protein